MSRAVGKNVYHCMIAVSVIKLTQGRDEGERPDSWEKRPPQHRFFVGKEPKGTAHNRGPCVPPRVNAEATVALSCLWIFR